MTLSLKLYTSLGRTGNSIKAVLDTVKRNKIQKLSILKKNCSKKHLKGYAYFLSKKKKKDYV